ncbi:hypothetical protein FA95DRAFT_1507658 [Auriscalpium vulgare]|uniref:Uncharacterized protein n=1 Tax=Auriscalpium vulgare TaxID=40419 RepID=A0ACB8SC45_9AGAM|nr:hypothetical protein FA95DRAFT_1507658 [Auriscalpium vulgare]
MAKKSSSKLKPKTHHAYAVLLFILGTLFPPLAVAARFGIGSDFWLNLFLTLAGYIPGHVHNFYIQNIRNNKNHARTPKWAQRYGLVDTKKIQRNAKRSEWANRYDERLPNSALDGQALAEGQEPGGSSSLSISSENGPPARRANGGNNELWNPDEEQYYGQEPRRSSSGGGGRWHYPANFEDTTPYAGPASPTKKKKKDKKDRFARTEDAYSITEETPRRKKKRSTRRRSTVGEDDAYSHRSGSTGDFPEDPEGTQYAQQSRGAGAPAAARQTNDEQIFNHEF